MVLGITPSTKFVYSLKPSQREGFPVVILQSSTKFAKIKRPRQRGRKDALLRKKWLATLREGG